MYSPEQGQLADSTWRAQAIAAFAGDYIIDGCGVSLGDSATSIETTIEPGTVRFGNDVLAVEQQSVTHPDGPAPGGGPEGGDQARVDLVTIDSSGSAGRMTGQPMVPDPPDRRFPNTLQPVPPTPQPSDNVVVAAALVVPNGTGSSAELFADSVVLREVMGDGLNDLELIPGRDLQYVLDSAREGATLDGDRSTELVVDQPLTINTPDITIRDLNVVYGDGVASSDIDDMFTVAAEGVSLENITIDGNKAGQTAEPDGITITASGCEVRNIRGRNTAGHLINVNGGSRRVEGTSIENVRGEDCRKDVLMIQGDDAITTKARGVRGVGSDNRGTITVRNGCNEVVLEDPRGQDQLRVLHFEDFGTDNDASAAVQNVRVDGLKASSCNNAVSHGLSREFNHADFTFRDMSLSDMSPTGASVIALRGVGGVRVQDCALTGSWEGAQALGLSFCSRVRVADNDVTHGGTGIEPGIRLHNCGRIKVVGNECYDIPRGIIIDATQGVAQQSIRVVGNTFRGVSGNAVQFTEDGEGSQLDRVIVRENFTGGAGIYDQEISGQKTINSNY